MEWQASGDHLGVLIVDGMASLADKTGAIVPIGNTMGNGFTTLAAIVHSPQYKLPCRFTVCYGHIRQTGQGIDLRSWHKKS